MCGRFYLDADAEFLINYFKLRYEPRELPIQAVVYPSQSSPILIHHKNEKRIGLMQWGVQLPGIQRPIINARSETIHEKDLFKAAFEKKRCIIPASGFFEWQEGSNAKPKPMYRVKTTSDPLMLMAGIYMKQTDASGMVNWRFSVVTRDANAQMQAIHHRMPLILDLEHAERWLSGEVTLSERMSLLKFDGVEIQLESVDNAN